MFGQKLAPEIAVPEAMTLADVEQRLNPTREPAPTPAEIAAFRARIPPRTPRIPVALPPAPAPGISTNLPPAEIMSPTLGSLSTEQRLLEDYRRRTAPQEGVFDPTQVNVGPGRMAQEEIAAHEAATLRQRIRTHPRSRILPVAPLDSFLNAATLPDLREYYRRLSSSDVPAEVMP